MIQQRHKVGMVYSGTVSESVVFDVRGVARCSCSAKSLYASWPASLVITVQVSQDGYLWTTAQFVNSDTGSLTAVSTFTGDGIRHQIHVSDVAFVRASVTTASGTERIEIEFYAEGDVPTASTMSTPGGGSITDAPDSISTDKSSES